MRPLDAHQMGVLTSGMSDASCATLLRRSAHWVAERRAELLGSGDDGSLDFEREDSAISDLEIERPEAVRFARRFKRAGWSLRDIAWLFDVEAEDLAEALL